MLVVFRTDASIQIGTGHIMRCLTLADEMARQGHECLFICREHLGHLGHLVVGKNHKLILLPTLTDTPLQRHRSPADDYTSWLGALWQEDARQTLDAISPLNPDWLIVDHYALDSEWESTLSSAVKKIMVIDDLANRPHECALMLDQNLGCVTSDYDGLLPGKCQRLIGPRYALLRPEFAALREQSLKRRKNPEIKRILISFGGVDRDNVTGQILTALSRSSLPDGTALDIIMGVSAPHSNEVRQQAAELRFKATVSVNVQDMAQRMCQADLSIGAVGSTSWERCCLGLPSILVVLAENQRSAAEALKNSGAVIIPKSGMAVRAELESLLSSPNTERKLIRMTELGSAMVQGDGCKKVVKKLSAASQVL